MTARIAETGISRGFQGAISVNEEAGEMGVYPPQQKFSFGHLCWPWIVHSLAS